MENRSSGKFCNSRRLPYSDVIMLTTQRTGIARLCRAATAETPSACFVVTGDGKKSEGGGKNVFWNPKGFNDGRERAEDECAGPTAVVGGALGRRPCETSTKSRIGTGGSTVARRANGTGQAPGGGRREQRRAPGPRLYRRATAVSTQQQASKSSGAAQRPEPVVMIF